MSSTKGNVLLYDACADAFRERRALLHSLAMFTQLASIEGSSLRAPEGEQDDRADAHALALWLVQHHVKDDRYLPPPSMGPRPTPGGGVHSLR
jgi:hypothetical protein